MVSTIVKKLAKELEGKVLGVKGFEVVTEKNWNKALREHLKRYYKKKKIVRIEKKKKFAW